MIKFAVAVAVMPAAVLLLFETAAAFLRICSVFRDGFPFLGGAVLYAVMHYFVYRPERLYVFVHELTHAVTAWSSGFKVKRMKVGRSGGSVVLDGSNAFVALAPYCLPLFAALWAVAYAVLGRFYNMTPWLGFFLLGMGFFLAFHVINTVEVLTGTGQSDLKAAGGTVFSLAVIVLVNCLVLLAAFKFLFPYTVAVRSGASGVIHGTLVFWQWVIGMAADLCGRFYSAFNK